MRKPISDWRWTPRSSKTTETTTSTGRLVSFFFVEVVQGQWLTEAAQVLITIPHVAGRTPRDHQVYETLRTMAVSAIDQGLVRV